MQELARPLLYRSFYFTLGPGAGKLVYSMAQRGQMESISRWTWHIVVDVSPEQSDSAICILSRAAALRALRVVSVVSASILATAASSAGETLEALVVAMYKSDYLVLVEIGRFRHLRQLDVDFLPRAVRPLRLRGLPGWNLPFLTDLCWTFKKIGAGIGDHAHLAFLSRCCFPRLRSLSLVLPELEAEQAEDLKLFFEAHPHLRRFGANIKKASALLDLLPDVTTPELCLRHIMDPVIPTLISPTVESLTVETYSSNGQ
jgi:hypothetical protein